uniref:Uncharacterized protein n=1 Tax=Glossina palpalis gambiensis TaxID=67801 RepID=A0A1B0BIR7_9MUSC
MYIQNNKNIFASKQLFRANDQSIYEEQYFTPLARFLEMLGVQDSLKTKHFDTYTIHAENPSIYGFPTTTIITTSKAHLLQIHYRFNFLSNQSATMQPLLADKFFFFFLG